MVKVTINTLPYHSYIGHPDQPGLALLLVSQVISHQAAGLNYHVPFPPLGDRLLIEGVYQLRSEQGYNGHTLARDLMFTNFAGGPFVITVRNPNGGLSVHVDHDVSSSRYVDFKPNVARSIDFETPAIKPGSVGLSSKRADAAPRPNAKNSPKAGASGLLAYITSLFS